MQSASLLCDQRQQRAVSFQGEFMSKDRGRFRAVKSEKDHAPRPRNTVRLASGVRVDGGEKNSVFVLICADGNVQLNSGAVAILRLCDGSRDRAAIVAELMRGSHRHALADEIVEFLDAALARGWIVLESATP
jgi:pyrroloquinoline quinone biosynthesis protein D